MQGCLQSLRQCNISLVKRYFTVFKHSPKPNTKKLISSISVFFQFYSGNLINLTHYTESYFRRQTLIWNAGSMFTLDLYWVEKILFVLFSWYMKRLTRRFIKDVTRFCIRGIRRFRTLAKTPLTVTKTRVKASLEEQ